MFLSLSKVLVGTIKLSGLDELILTSASGLQDAYLIEVEKSGLPRRYPAEIVLKDYRCMLALVRVKDPSFGKGLIPLAVGQDAPLHAKGTFCSLYRTGLVWAI